MKQNLIMIFLCFLVSCGNETPESTETYSSAFTGLAAKKEFFEKYVAFRREYKNLDFYVSYYNGGKGSIPAPSDWYIVMVAEVEKNELKNWTTDMIKTSSKVNAEWLGKLKTTIDFSKINEWYEKDKRIVGVDEINAVVVYFNSSHKVH